MVDRIKKVRLKIFRYNPKTESQTIKPKYDTFELDLRPGLTVLGSLFQVQDRFDDTLSFRYSCRGAVCGTCAMLINRLPRLACRTQVANLLETNNSINTANNKDLVITPTFEHANEVTWDPKQEILIEPLPNLKVIKDLVVDMGKFFEQYRKIKPILEAATALAEQEHLMEPAVVTELENYTNCILCAACFGACPVNREQPDYLGPAALAKLYRFHIDTRNKDRDGKLKLANDPSGWWGCNFHLNCKQVCPKGVQPNLAIGRARKRIKDLGWINNKKIATHG